MACRLLMAMEHSAETPVERCRMFLDKVVFNKTKVPILNAVLDVTQLRQRVIANNIANVGTQGFRKQSVRFQDFLESFVGRPGVTGTVANARHMTIPGAQGSPEVYEAESGVNDSGINNVDVDGEMAALAENHLFFNAGQRLMSRQFAGLKKSITGRAR
jgi:flagellar basal-body rod protein FlgB